MLTTLYSDLASKTQIRVAKTKMIAALFELFIFIQYLRNRFMFKFRFKKGEINIRKVNFLKKKTDGI